VVSFSMLTVNADEHPVMRQFHKAGDEKRTPETIDISTTILQHALGRGEGVLSTNAMSDPRFRKGDSVQRLSIRSAMCVPVRSGQRTFGAIYIDSSVGSANFTAERLALMNAIGQQTALARSYDDLGRLYEEIVSLHRKAIEAAALAHPECVRFSDGRAAKKIVLVPGRLVNVVV
jgi:GAF domain-containing protein